MQKITPFLWFDNNAEEAINYYISVFKNSSIKSIKRYGQEVPGMEGKVLSAVFELDGQEFIALDGGPQFKFTEAISFLVDCKSQEEVNYFWDILTKEGEEGQCGWLKDKFGMSWQIIPSDLMSMLSDPDKEKSGRVMVEMLKMKKIDINLLKSVYEK